MAGFRPAMRASGGNRTGPGFGRGPRHTPQIPHPGSGDCEQRQRFAPRPPGVGRYPMKFCGVCGEVTDHAATAVMRVTYLNGMADQPPVPGSYPIAPTAAAGHAPRTS